MITDIKTDGLDACGCGHKPEHYSIAYGRSSVRKFTINSSGRVLITKYKRIYAG